MSPAEEPSKRPTAAWYGNLRRREAGGIHFLEFPHLAAVAGLRHGVSWRMQSDGTRWDFDFREQSVAAAAQTEQLRAAVGLADHNLVRPEQVHGSAVAIVTQGVPSRPRADAACTAADGGAVLLVGADCPLLIVADPGRQVVGLAHAGWRGTVQQIATALIEAMVGHWGCRPTDCRAGIGPGICGTCYQVGAEVADALRTQWEAADVEAVLAADERAPGHWRLDLVEANRRQLIRAGVPVAQVKTSGICTYESGRAFPSYRRDGAAAGRWVMLAGWVP